MANVAELAPGVYVEEVSSGIKPISGVGTSTAAFIGLTETGVENKPVLITSWSEYVREFGGFWSNFYLPYAVYGFFAEGGSKCYVVRVTPSGATKAKIAAIKSDDGQSVLAVEALSKGKWGNRVTIIIEDASDNQKKNDQGEIEQVDPKLFKLTVKYQEADAFKAEYEGDDVVEVYDRVSLFDVVAKVNAASSFVNLKLLTELPTTENEIISYQLRPVSGVYPLIDGSDDGTETGDFVDADFIAGLNTLESVEDVNMIAIPDKAGDREIILEGLRFCKQRKDCFFIADPPFSQTITGVLDFKNATGDYQGNAFNSSYGALYYPWIYINDPLTKRKKLIPPSGLVAGTYAYTDTIRGVHKAPAGIYEGKLDWAVGVETVVTKAQQELLNPEGINVIRSFTDGICIWGARTLASDSEWQYINIRRLFMYVEKTIERATQWVVFEPNEPGLWGKVSRNLTAFLTRVWRDGALFGSSPEEAFYVKVDAENNPPADRDLGILNIEVGIAPVKPAEFVIIRVSQKTLS